MVYTLQSFIQRIAAVAVRLKTPRKIAGVDFDGSAPIGIPLENLSNVNIVSPVDGQAIVLDGTRFKNAAVAGGLWDTVTGGINYAGGNVGIGTDTPTTAIQVGAIAPSTTNNIFTLTGYDNFGMRWNAYNGWSDYYFTTGYNSGLHIYNVGQNNPSNTLELGTQSAGNALLQMRTNNAVFIQVGTNANAPYPVARMGTAATTNNYTGDMYIESSYGPGQFKRFTFKNTGDFAIAGKIITGSGNKVQITNSTPTTVDAMISHVGATTLTAATFTTQERKQLSSNGVMADAQITDMLDSTTQTNIQVRVNGALTRVNVGAADSGGSGQRLLTIAN